MFLLHLRHEATTGAFDARDYSDAAPLGFIQQAETWLSRKRGEVTPKTAKHLERIMSRAAKVWGNRNIKAIKAGDIEDFLFGLPVGNKTRHSHKSVLHDFWTWLSRRENVPMPIFPEISFKLGWRQIIDLPTQQMIIDEIKRISYARNPKAWLAIRMLTRYFHIRPGELVRITEGNINLQIPVMILPPKSSKTGEPVMVFLWEDDVDEIKRLPRGLPALPFFRHPAGTRGCARAGEAFGSAFLYKLWLRACKNLGLMRSETLPICDLYAGTRHSTITALGEVMSPEEIQQASGHRTGAAFVRYMQGRARYAQKATAAISDLQKRARGETAQVVSLEERRVK